MLKLAAAVVAALTVVGCTGSPAAHPSAPHTSAPQPPQTSARHRPAPPLGAPGCKPPSPVVHDVVRGTSTSATLYGLVMVARSLPIRAREDVKIVWRMTGRGPLRLSVTGPHGTKVPLEWGPEAHGGSNFNRPGREWGAGYRFASAGCWRLHAVRGGASADVWVRVRA